MRKRWNVQFAGPVLCAMLMLGCGGSDGANDDRPAQLPKTNAAEEAAPAQATVALSGCVEAAPGSNQYVLRSVRFEPRKAGDPHATTTTPGAHGITEGAHVRLAAAEGQNLLSHPGQRVMVKGVISDSGANTIGTAGTPGRPTADRSGDRSQAGGTEGHAEEKKTEAGRIGRESMADGTAAEVRVQSIEPTGEKCQTGLRPEAR